MDLPRAILIEVPVLQELLATSGVEDVRYLYARLTPYFPHIVDAVESDSKLAASWRKSIQRAGRQLEVQKLIKRANGRWMITDAGRRRAAAEQFEVDESDKQTLPIEISHADAQRMLIEVGQALGFYGVTEYEYFDVVWKTNRNSPRLSHVFEVQRRGNLDSALAKLKKAYDAQRSKTYLVVASERDTRRARRAIDANMSGAFHELASSVEILSFEQLAGIHRALKIVREILPSLCER